MPVDTASVDSLLPVADICPAFDEIKALVMPHSPQKTLLYSSCCDMACANGSQKPQSAHPDCQFATARRALTMSWRVFHSSLHGHVKVAHPNLFVFLAYLQLPFVFVWRSIIATRAFSSSAEPCRYFHSRIFHLCRTVPMFPLPHFPPLHFVPCRIFHSLIFNAPYMTPLRSVTCHMGSHSVTYYPCLLYTSPSPRD